MEKGRKCSAPQGRHSSLTYCRTSKGAALHSARLPGDANMLQVAFYLSHSSTQTKGMNKSYEKQQKLCKSWLTRQKIRQREACPVLPEPNHDSTCIRVRLLLQLAFSYSMGAQVKARAATKSQYCKLIYFLSDLLLFCSNLDHPFEWNVSSQQSAFSVYLFKVVESRISTMLT